MTLTFLFSSKSQGDDEWMVFLFPMDKKFGQLTSFEETLPSTVLELSKSLTTFPQVMKGKDGQTFLLLP